MVVNNRTLVMDVGGIFFSPMWREKGIKAVSSELGVKEELLVTAINENKRNFYLGKMTENDYWLSVSKKLGLTSNLTEWMMSKYRNFVTPVEKNIKLLPALSDRYKLIAFNNAPREWMDYRIKISSLNVYFSMFLTSGYTGYMKPESTAFENMLQKATGDKIVYLDDNEDYLMIGRKQFGLSTVLIRSHKDLAKLLS